MAEKIEQVGGDVPDPGTKRKTNEPGTSGSQCNQLPTGDQQTQSDIRRNPALKAPITSKLDFVRFLDHFLPNLLLLSVVLAIESQAADILKDRSNATEKCLNLLGMWLSVTANPTWELFCSLLQRHANFNHVRSLIEAGSCTLLGEDGDDGGVGQALATAFTTNITLKEIDLYTVSPFSLMKALTSREVPLGRLLITAHPTNEDPNPCTPETLETLAQNMKVVRFEWQIGRWTIEEATPFADGLSRNEFLKDIDVRVFDDNVKNYITTKLSSLKKVHVLVY